MKYIVIIVYPMQFNFVLQILDTPDTKMILTAAREVESIATNYSTKVSSFQVFLNALAEELIGLL